MSLKLYYDFLSQPSRALYIILHTSNIPFEKRPVALRRGAHLSDDFEYHVSKFQKVPVLHDAGFRLNESVAILRYLSREYDLLEQLYPKDAKLQAKVDEYLEWQHLNIRANCALFFIKSWITPLLTGQSLSAEKLDSYKQRMSECLDAYETLWLNPGPFITGNQLTAADIWAACEIEQPRAVGYDPTVGRPVLAAWLHRVRNESHPSYAEAHDMVNKMAEKAARKSKL